MNKHERLIDLKLKQASRREIPIHLVVLLLGSFLVYVLLDGLVQWLRGK